MGGRGGRGKNASNKNGSIEEESGGLMEKVNMMKRRQKEERKAEWE